MRTSVGFQSSRETSPDRVIGIVARSDVIAAHARRLDGERLREPHYRFARARAAGVTNA